jgi:hypothetical protein
LVDAWSAIEEARLTYIRLNQHTAADDEEYIGTGDEELVDDVRLPSTFIHSPSWSAANISDCLALRKALGPVTLFITFTTNPRWPEITSQLLPGQSANDRPDLIVREFQQYLSSFMKDLHSLFGPVLYHIRVTKFQSADFPTSILLLHCEMYRVALQISTLFSVQNSHAMQDPSEML